MVSSSRSSARLAAAPAWSRHKLTVATRLVKASTRARDTFFLRVMSMSCSEDMARGRELAGAVITDSEGSEE